MNLDKDLLSIQEVRTLVKKADAAQKVFATWSQEQVDALVERLARECEKELTPLAKMAAEETGFGVWQDKVLKNYLGSRMTWEYIRDMKTRGIIHEDKENRILDIAVPMGVIAALIPSTNPTSTVMYKTLISLKAGNGIVISPHPNARKCILETARILQKAAREGGAPEGLIGCIENPTMQGVDALMKHPDVGLILATGSTAMVKAAYSSGTPALGVGPGNGPSYIERSADIPLAVKRIMDSKTFDNGTICASEQSIITEESIREDVIAEVKRQGGYFLNEEESKRLGKIIMRANNTMNPAIVGKNALTIARMAGVAVPETCRVLVSEQTDISHSNPYAREKLCPILAFYTGKDWKECCEKSIAILENEGAGHTMTIHSRNGEVIREFALYKPVSRLLVNTPGALGGVGATTALPPALTLGCGAVGGSATSDNVSPLNLFNIRRAAYGVRELESLRAAVGMSTESPDQPQPENITQATFSEKDIDFITKEVLNAIRKNKNFKNI